MTMDQLTDIAWAIVDELQPQYSYDVFEVSDSHILFESEHGLKRVCLDCLPDDALKESIKAELKR